MNLNKIMLIGHMARDPEIKVMGQSGNKVCNFAVATNESYKGKDGVKVDRAEFHNVVVYGATGENCAKYLRKGQLVMIEGKVATRTWDDKDGLKHYKTEVIAYTVQFGPKLAGQGQGASQMDEWVIDADTGEKRPTKRKEPVPAVIALGQARQSDDKIEYPLEEINPDDIPF